MKLRILILALVALSGTGALADLKPDALDCDPKKAARNAAMDATVGVSGRCDPGKAAKNTKQDVVDDVKDSVDVDLDKKKHPKGLKNRD